MTRRRQAQLLAILLRRSEWVTAADLADRLGVTPRSVRTYVTAINGSAPGADAIASGPKGYRATPSASGLRLGGGEPARGTPRERLHHLVRLLLDRADGVDVARTAAALFVSEATIEADVRRVRALIADDELSLARSGALVWLEGSELARRRLLSRVVHEATGDQTADPEALRHAAEELGIDTAPFRAFTADLVERLSELGLIVNELAAADVVLHVAIAAERVARGRPLAEPAGQRAPEHASAARIVGELASLHFGVELGAGDRHRLGSLVWLSIVDPGSGGASARDVDPRVVDAVRASVARVAHTYALEIDEADLRARLAPHVQNLVRRAAERLWSRNPMTRSLKAATPLVFEMAVAIAGDLSAALDVPIPDDEISDIAMHLGAAIGPDSRPSARLTAVLVCPGYDAMRQHLRASIAGALGHEIELTAVSTRYDPDWAGFDADLVLTTIDPSPGGEGAAAVVRISPFLSERDVARVSEAAARVRRQRRLSGLRAEISRWFVPGAFARDIDAPDPESVIRRLGRALVAEGVIGEDYVESAIERERLSSTAFTESLAVPHAMTMSAARTAISVAVCEQPVAWGSERVHVVALVAFSDADRAAFQTVFEQFVDVFADADNARRIARRGIDLPAFVAELAALIDDPARV
ncbi:BglG family transcription antiterminator [Microbacterium sp. gxy059]|uniref:BglG family transcription antiterminator n=1 Tax=Microbacterium sp. gxy059 TaxID=2957199 RepID=UPI003D971541